MKIFYTESVSEHSQGEARSSATRPSPREVAAGQLGTGQIGADEGGFLQAGAGKIGALQVGAGEIDRKQRGIAEAIRRTAGRRQQGRGANQRANQRA